MNRRNFNKFSLTFFLTAISTFSLLNGPAYASRDTEEPFRINPGDQQKLKQRFRRKKVSYRTAEPTGTIIINPYSKYLYLILGGGQAMRYGVGVGRQGFEWSGEAVIRRKAKWPRWTPPKEMVERDELAAKWANGMPGGPENPLGARALYLFQGQLDTLYRIHGTFQPETIGKAVSSGCIRLINADIADLYERVQLGARVLVVSESDMVANNPVTSSKRSLFDRLFSKKRPSHEREMDR